jgi:hypothetical protein
MNFLARLRRLMRKPINKARFDELHAASPKRFSFAKKPTALSRGEKGPAVGFLNVSFPETFETILPWTIETAKGRYGDFHRRVVRDEGEFQRIAAWIDSNKEIVFIRSLLDSCVALAEHQTEPGCRSAIGELERSAKFDANKDSENHLVEAMIGVYRRLHSDLEIDAVCSVPPSKADQLSLPNRIASRMAAELNLNDLTSELNWASVKPSVKELPVSEKWNALEKVGLTLSEAFKGRNILIIDDMYQSGSTIHFVASKLREAGCNDIHCFAVVKALGDTDNV